MFEPTLSEFRNISFADYIAAAEKLIDSSIGCFKVRYSILAPFKRINEHQISNVLKKNAVL